MKIRTFVVDDSAFFRKTLSELLEKIPAVEFAGHAANGSIALSKIGYYQPDLITLDVEMPEMDGLTVLKHIRETYPDIQVVMLSSASQKSAQITIDALRQGALDFIEKPNLGNYEANERQLFRELRRIINLVETKAILNQSSKLPARILPQTHNLLDREESPAYTASNEPLEIIVIGVSTGGPAALPFILEKLPLLFPVPIVIVQHMPALFVKVLVETLNRRSKLNVIEAESGAVLEKGNVYIAPGGRQMKIIRNPANNLYEIRLTDDPMENYCRPSVDYLFRSVANCKDAKTLAIIMTGMGKDGVEGLKLLKEKGAKTFAQDQSTSVVFGMPMEAIKAGVIDKVLSLDKIADNILMEIEKNLNLN